jgi:hypothetical protein
VLCLSFFFCSFAYFVLPATEVMGFKEPFEYNNSPYLILIVCCVSKHDCGISSCNQPAKFNPKSMIKTSSYFCALCVFCVNVLCVFVCFLVFFYYVQTCCEIETGFSVSNLCTLGKEDKTKFPAGGESYWSAIKGTLHFFEF